VVISGSETVGVSSEDGSDKRIDVPLGREYVFVAGGADTGGLQSLRVEVVSGGTLEIGGDRVIDSTVTNTVENDTTEDSSTIPGLIQFDSQSEGSEVILRATARDFAGNQQLSPNLTLVNRRPPEARLMANRTTIDRGDPVMLSYDTEHSSNVMLNGTTLSTPDGTLTRTPSQTTEYVLVARGSVGGLGIASDTVGVQVRQPPAMVRVNSFTSSSSRISQGDNVTLRWDVTNASQLQIVTRTPNGSTNTFSVSGSTGSSRRSPSQIGSHSYTLEAINSAGSLTRTLNVQVVPPPSQCSTSPNGPVAFRYSHRISDTRYWVMDLSRITSMTNPPIVSVRNAMNTTVTLSTVSGTTQHLRAGKTSNAWDGQSVLQRWDLQVEKKRDFTDINIEFCTKP
jgi:hypothetical protein